MDWWTLEFRMPGLIEHELRPSSHFRHLLLCTPNQFPQTSLPLPRSFNSIESSPRNFTMQPVMTWRCHAGKRIWFCFKKLKQPWRGSPSWCSYPPCHPDTKVSKVTPPFQGLCEKTTRNNVTPSSTVTRKRFVSSLYLGSIRMQTSPLLNRLRMRCGLFDSCHEPVQLFCSLECSFTGNKWHYARR